MCMWPQADRGGRARMSAHTCSSSWRLRPAGAEWLLCASGHASQRRPLVSGRAKLTTSPRKWRSSPVGTSRRDSVPRPRTSVGPGSQWQDCPLGWIPGVACSRDAPGNATGAAAAPKIGRVYPTRDRWWRWPRPCARSRSLAPRSLCPRSPPRPCWRP